MCDVKIIIVNIPPSHSDIQKAQQLFRENKGHAIVMTPKYDSNTKITLDKHVTKPGLYVLT